jgi:hypothetical protein
MIIIFLDFSGPRPIPKQNHNLQFQIGFQIKQTSGFKGQSMHETEKLYPTIGSGLQPVLLYLGYVALKAGQLLGGNLYGKSIRRTLSIRCIPLLLIQIHTAVKNSIRSLHWIRTSNGAVLGIQGLDVAPISLWALIPGTALSFSVLIRHNSMPKVLS